MILGVGSDLIDVRRIERTIERHGDRFLARIFTAAERAKAESRARRAETYAKRFAAKEACAKALGTGLRAGVFWRDMGVVNLGSGRPTMKLTGGALARRSNGSSAGGDLGGAAHVLPIVSVPFVATERAKRDILYGARIVPTAAAMIAAPAFQPHICQRLRLCLRAATRARRKQVATLWGVRAAPEGLTR